MNRMYWPSRRASATSACGNPAAPTAFRIASKSSKCWPVIWLIAPRFSSRRRFDFAVDRWIRAPDGWLIGIGLEVGQRGS